MSTRPAGAPEPRVKYKLSKEEEDETNRQRPVLEQQNQSEAGSSYDSDDHKDPSLSPSCVMLDDSIDYNGTVGVRCRACARKFGRFFRRKKRCKNCGLDFCSSCMTKKGCKSCSSESEESGVLGGAEGADKQAARHLNRGPLSLEDLKPYETRYMPWDCRLPAPSSIFRCRDREVAANLSIGEDDVVNYKTHLSPSVSCSCEGKLKGSKHFQSALFEGRAIAHGKPTQEIPKWTSVRFLMDYLSIGETYLFVTLKGMSSVFYGVARVKVQKLQKFRRVVECLDVTCRNSDDVVVRIRGSMCWKIYNEDFEGPAPLAASPLPKASQRSRTEVRTLAEVRTSYMAILSASRFRPKPTTHGTHMRIPDLTQPQATLSPRENSHPNRPVSPPGFPECPHTPIRNSPCDAALLGDYFGASASSVTLIQPGMEDPLVLRRPSERQGVSESRETPATPQLPQLRATRLLLRTLEQTFWPEQGQEKWDPEATFRMACPFCSKPVQCIFGKKGTGQIERH